MKNVRDRALSRGEEEESPHDSGLGDDPWEQVLEVPAIGERTPREQARTDRVTGGQIPSEFEVPKRNVEERAEPSREAQ